jgi:glucose-6-phosphate isomerase
VPDQRLTAGYPTDLPAWRDLESHYQADMKSASIGSLFAGDDNRFQSFSVEAADLFLDYSKNLIGDQTRELLVELARQCDLTSSIEAMFVGDIINSTESRPALHVALRAHAEDGVAAEVAGVNEIWQTLDRMEAFVAAVQSGEVRGHTGRRLTEIVNIGIGGSDLGLVMACEALRHHWAEGMHFHSVSNVDGTQLVDLVEALDPERTLFIICSKTFTTLETLTNARAAADWIRGSLGQEAVGAHFAAASTNHQAMDEFGVNPDYRFGFWDWVGGRFSLWSAVGLSLALVVGMENFRAMLAGARDMDRHFRSAPPEANMPVLLALIGIWYNNFCGAQTQAILPYDNRLARFPAFLQQMQMESSGKSVRIDQQPVQTDTGMVIWGEAGSNAQHSFYQLLHQGTRFVPADFLLPLLSSGGSQHQQELAVANCLAQSEALMDGFHPGSGERFREHAGNRPSNTIMFERLSPAVLGQLVALYEHKVYAEGLIWGINSFDQWGVELGKRLASQLAAAVSGETDYQGTNPSTAGLLSRARHKTRD